MRHFVPFACLLMVMACSAPEQPEDALEEEAVAAPNYAATAFEVTDEEGASYQSYINEDGTYFVMRNGALFQSGEWRTSASGALCLTSGAENEEEACWTPSEPDENGVAEYTSDTGVKLNGRPIDYVPPEMADATG